mmetsp:Transcript_41075/g.62177  ORF Transcript_41075/g.62177 Transcript_41075/m.62177 type:complete len:233 (+) Transcript_41075:318-1016(+)
MTPLETKDAWMSYQWEQGGGLPGVIVLLSDNDDNNSNDVEMVKTQKKNGKRRLLPIWMEEVIVDDNDDDNKSNKQAQEETIRYKVTDMGLFSTELENNSHSALVRFFVDNNDKNPSNTTTTTTTMVWDVTFQSKSRPELWKSITQQNIQTATDNLASYSATPYVYTRITKLKNGKSGSTTASSANENSIEDVVNQWTNFIWKRKRSYGYSTNSVGTNRFCGRTKRSYLLHSC